MSDTNIEKRLDALESRLAAVSIMASDTLNSPSLSISYFDEPINRIQRLESSQADAEKRISDTLAAFAKTIEAKQHSISNAAVKTTLDVVAEVMNERLAKIRSDQKSGIDGISSDIEATKVIASRSTREAEDILLSACNYFGS